MAPVIRAGEGVPPLQPAAPPPGQPPGAARLAVVWLPGLAVALGAAAATAHGLYETALAARVPAVIAWLYPLITDGLALVAYTATARLHTPTARRYAWAVVVLAAGLSGLAQAAYLASGATLDARPALRFGVGAWPAIAAAIVAHLLYLLATDTTTASPHRTGVAPPWVALSHPPTGRSTAHRSIPARSHNVSDNRPPTPARPDRALLSGRPATGLDTGVRPETPAEPDRGHPEPGPAHDPAADRPSSGPGDPRRTPDIGASDTPTAAPARERAQQAAVGYATRHHRLPTVRQLVTLAQVSRGTAADALKTLRAHPTPLHLVTDTPDEDTQP